MSNSTQNVEEPLNVELEVRTTEFFLEPGIGFNVSFDFRLVIGGKLSF